MAKFKDFLPSINPLEAQWLTARFANHFGVNRSSIEESLGIGNRASELVVAERAERRETRRGERLRGSKGRHNLSRTPITPTRLLPSGDRPYWEDKLLYWEKRILRALLEDNELRDYFEARYNPRHCFQSRVSFSF